MKTSRKRILIIAYYFPPLAGSGTIRTLKYVKYLPVFNWIPYVLTVQNAHHLTFDPKLEQQIPAVVSILRTKAILPARFFRKKLNYNIGNRDKIKEPKFRFFIKLFEAIKKIIYTFIFCPDEYVGWIPFAFWKGLKVLRGKEQTVIYSSSPPNSTHLIAYLLKKVTNNLWIADFRDLWDQYPESYNPYRIRWKQKFDDYFEHNILTKADRVVVISDTMKNQLVEKYPDITLKKFKVIHNGFDSEDFNQYEIMKKEDHKCLILHAGSLLSWRKTPNFFAALKELIDENTAFSEEVKLQLMGLVFNDVRKEIGHRNLNSHIEIIPHQSYESAIRKMKSVDYLLLIVGDLPKAQNALALKLFDYIGAKKPILALAPPGETADLILNYNLGFVADPNKKNEIRNVLEAAYKTWKFKSIDFEPFFQTIQKRFDRKYLTGQLSNLLEEINA